MHVSLDKSNVLGSDTSIWSVSVANSRAQCACSEVGIVSSPIGTKEFMED